MNRRLKKIKQPFMPLIFFLRKIFLKNRDFSIISNNCWGGFVYQFFGIEYKTPFIGLFMYSPCYIKMLKEIDIIYQELRFIDPTKSHYVSYLQEIGLLSKQYPIGVLGDDIEIHFLHYSTAEEARTKWEKRLQRLNKNNLLVKFSVDKFCNEELLKTFNSFEYQNKILFTKTKYPDIQSTVFLPELKNSDTVKNEHRYYRKHMNIRKYLNSMIRS